VTRLVIEHLLEAPIPRGELICHTCDVPRCVNPAHLYRGDDVTNTADKIQRGRLPYGEGSGRAKLTTEQVRYIRATFTGVYGQIAAMARRFGVDHTTISAVIRGRSWRYVA